MRDSSNRRWWHFIALVAGFLWASPAARADDEPGEVAYERAAEAHADERYAEAATGFIAAHEAGHRPATAAYNAACALARAGKIDDAFRWLDRAYDAGFDLEAYLDDDRDLRALRGDARFARLRARAVAGRASLKEREAAPLLARYRALRARKDAGPDEHDDLGRELLGVGRYEEAAWAFETAAAAEENPASSLYNAACARALKGQKGPALELLQRAVEQGFADPEHLDEDDDLDAVRQEARFREIRALAAELEAPGAPSQLDAGNPKLLAKWRAALPRIEAAARKHPRLGQAWFNLGLARIVLGQPGQAVTPLEKAIELGYRKPTSMYNLACAHALAGDKDQAFAWLDKAVAGGFDEWWLLRQDADLDDVRYDPRFRKFLELARARERARWRGTSAN